MSNLLDNGTIKIVTAVIGFFAIAGLIAAESAWKTNISRDVQQIKRSLDTLESFELVDRLKGLESKTQSRWHRHNMMLWQLETEKLNPKWHGADIDP